MLGHHLVEVFAGAGPLAEQPLRVKKVAAGLVDGGRVVGQVLVLVVGDDGGRMQRGHLVERVEPGFQAGVANFQQHRVHAVVDDIARHDQADGRHVQHGGVVGVGVPDLDGGQPMAFQFEAPGRNRLGQHGRVADQAGEVLVPVVRPRVGLLVHLADGAFGGVHGGAGETLQHLGGAEPVVAVPVGDVDEGQPLAGPFDPVAQRLGLGHRPRRVGQHRVALAADQRG
jgi:hypothetical protein